MENRTNDWMATLLFNGDLAMNELSQIGITPENTSMQSKDYYKKMDAVQQAPEFCDENGVFQDAKFNAFYDNALNSYNKFTNEDYVKNLTSNYQFGRDAWFAPIESSILDTTPRFTINKDSINISEGVRRLYQFGDSTSNLSFREIAQTQNVIDSQTGKDLGYTPNEKGGFTAIFNRPTLVLAQYDTEGYHDENGIKVHHNAGDLKYNSAGKPYYETLGSRDIYGKDVLRVTDTLTVDGSTWNKYDFFDSDGIDKSVGKTIAHTVAQVAPMFVPYVGTAYGIITASQALNRLLPVLGKTLNGIATGTNDNELGHKLSKWEGFAAQFDQTQSDNSREHAISLENLGNMVGAVSGQLFQQRVISQIPQWLNKTDILKVNPELGKTLAFAYMAGTSSQEAYQDFKQAGASDRVAGFGMIANMMALYKLMNIDYFRDTLFKGSFLDESVTREVARGVAGNVDKNLLASAETASEKEAIGFINTLTKWYTDKLVPGLTKSEFINRSVSEGVEEMMEESVSDAIKGFTSAFNALGIPVTENKKELDFGFSGKDILTRYGMAFGGGVIGGAVFYGHGKWENWLHDQAMRQKYGDAAVDNLNQDDLQKLVYLIANGKGGEIRDYYKRWHKQGILGNKNLSSATVEANTIEGTKMVSEAVSDGMTQNDAVYAVLTNMVDNIEQLVMSEKMNFSEADLNKVWQLGWNPADKNMLRADALVNIGSYANFNNDLYKTISDIVKTKAELNNRINTLTGNPATEEEKTAAKEAVKNDKNINDLKKKLEDLRGKRDAMMKGDFNKYYSGQGFFAANTPLNSLYTGLSVENYTKVKYAKVYELLSAEEKEEINKEFEQYKNTQGKQNIYQAYDVYLSMAERWGAILAEKLKANPRSSGHHQVTTGFENYIALQKQVMALQQQQIELSKKETLTPEEINKLAEIEKDLNEKSEVMRSMESNPGTMTDLLLHGESELSKLFESGVELTDVGIAQIGKMVEDIYTEAATKGTIVESDGEYTAFLRMIKQQYSSSASHIDRFSDFFAQMAELYPRKNPDNSIYLNGDGEKELDIKLLSRLGKVFSNSFDSYDSATPEMKEVFTIIDSIFSNLGSDHATVSSKIDELLNKLKELGLEDNEITLFLDSFIPKVGTEYLTDYIKKVDSFRAKAPKSVINELLKEFCAVFNADAIPIIELIENEMKNLANAENIQTYLIQNEQVLEALDIEKSLKPLLRAAQGIIQGASDGTNQTINGYKGGEIANLIELDESQTHFLKGELDILDGRISAFLSIHESNKNQSLRIQKDIAISMRPKFIKYFISDITANKLKASLGIDTTDIWNNLGCPIALENVDENNFETIEPYIIKFEQAIFDNLKDKFSKEELASKLVSCFGKNLYKKSSSSLSEKGDEPITEYDAMLYLTSLIALPSQSFYERYRTKTSSDEFKFAPIYAQEFATRLTLAHFVGIDLFNEVLKEFHKSENMDLTALDPRIQDYVKNKSILYNFIITLGGAGTGKSTGYASTVIKMLGDEIDKSIVYLAPNNSDKNPQADNLKKNVGVEGDAYGKADFFKKAFGEDITTKEYVSNKDHKTLKEPLKDSALDNDNIFSSSKGVKILMIDEISCFTEYELKQLSKWATKHNIRIIALGDLKQDQALVLIKGDLNATGLEDCDYIKSPFLTASLRSANLAKFENYSRLNSILTEIQNEYEMHPEYDAIKLDSKFKEKIDKNKLELNYYEDSEVLYGEKLVKGDPDRKNIINDLQKLINLGGTIAIVTDPTNNIYDSFGDKVQIISPARLSQGGEWDYIIVDTDFTENNKTGSIANRYMIAKNLYTISQRSRIGSIIVNNTIPDGMVSSNNIPRLKQKFDKADDARIEEFKKWRLKALESLGGDGSTFVDFVKEAVKETASTPTHASAASGTTAAASTTAAAAATPATSSSASPAVAASTSAASTPGTTPGTISASSGASTPLSGTSPATTGASTAGIAGAVSPSTVGGTTTTPASIAPVTPPPITPPPPAGTAAITVGGGSSSKDLFINNDEYFEVIDSDDFYRAEQTIPHSLYSLVQASNEKYKEAIELLSSLVRCGYVASPYMTTNVQALKNILGNDTKVAALGNYLRKLPEIWVTPGENGRANIIARFKKSDTEYFDVLIGFTKTVKYGKLSKKVKGKEVNPIAPANAFSLGKTAEHVKLSTFKARNKHVFMSKKGAVVLASEEDINKILGDGRITGASKDFLLARNNNGKAMVFITSEYARMLHFLENDRNWAISPSGYTHSAEKGATLMGVQRAVNIHYLMNWVATLAGKKNIEDVILGARTAAKIPEPLTAIQWNALEGNPEAFYKEVDNRKYQVFTLEQTSRFTGIALSTLSNKDVNAFNNVLTNINLFLNTEYRPYNNKNGDKIINVNGIYIGDYFISMKNGKLYRYETSVVDGNHNFIVKYETAKEINKNNFFAECEWTPDKRFLLGKTVYTIEKGTNKEKISTYRYTPNDSLYMLFGNLHDNELDIIATDPKYVHNIYMQDVGEDIPLGASYWKSVNVNDEYYTDIETYNVESYKINIDDIDTTVSFDGKTPEVLPVVEAKPETLDNFVARIPELAPYSAGVNSSITLEQFNDYIIQNSKSPIYPIVVKNGDSYELTYSDMHHPEAWLAKKLTMATGDLPIDPSEISVAYNKLDNTAWNFSIFSVNLYNQYICRKVGDSYEFRLFGGDTTESQNAQLEIFNSILEDISASEPNSAKQLSLQNFLFASLFDDNMDSYTQAFLDNWITDENIMKKIEQYLLNRINNNEC